MLIKTRFMVTDGIPVGAGLASNRRVFDWTWTNLLNWKHALNANNDFYFEIMGGYESQYYNNYFLQAGGQVFPANLHLKIPRLLRLHR
jgi:hypothetical protein